MVAVHVHVPPCGKFSPVNIANGGQSWTDIKFSSAGGISLIIDVITTIQCNLLNNEEIFV